MKSRSDDRLNSIINKLNIKIQHVKKIKHRGAVEKTYYIIETQDKHKLFLKYQRKPRGITRKITRYILGNPTFRRQVELLSLFDKSNYRYLATPRLIDTDKRNYLVSEYIQYESRGIDIKHHRDDVVKGLIEFQTACINHNLIKRYGSYLHNIYMSLEYNILSKYRKYILTNFGMLIYIKCLYILFVCHKNQKRLNNYILIHNDYHHNNLILANNGRIYLIDLEGVSLGKKWILIDIVTIALYTKEYYIDVDIIRKYIAEIRSSIISQNNLDIRSQLRIALLRRTMQLLSSSVPPLSVKREYKKYFLEIIVSDDAYNNWYNINIKTYNGCEYEVCDSSKIR
jgi:hypothetical protein